jgi:hypothetical protein
MKQFDVYNNPFEFSYVLPGKKENEPSITIGASLDKDGQVEYLFVSQATQEQINADAPHPRIEIPAHLAQAFFSDPRVQKLLNL